MDRHRKTRIDQAAAAVAHGQPTGPDDRCGICGRRLTDHVSLARGIGPVCWGYILDEVGHIAGPAAVRPDQGSFAF